MRYLVTGGAGFIGSAFVRRVLRLGGGAEVLVLDALTYAGNLANLDPVAHLGGLSFEKVDVRDDIGVLRAFRRFRPDVVVHFAAESHVDRSIRSPLDFASANVVGTGVVLEASRATSPAVFVQVSTDEVYGSIPHPDLADEGYPLRTASPYSASKAGADMLALAYWRTYGLPVVISRASNTYGPRQFPEKLIPLLIANAFAGLPLPIYGDGLQVRDWLHLRDHVRAIEALITCARPGEVYNVSGDCRLANIAVAKQVLRCCRAQESLIRHVRDRPGHDRRYALDCGKIERETGWKPKVDFRAGLASTVRWYRENADWVAEVRSGRHMRRWERRTSDRLPVRLG